MKLFLKKAHPKYNDTFQGFLCVHESMNRNSSLPFFPLSAKEKYAVPFLIRQTFITMSVFPPFFNGLMRYVTLFICAA